MEEKKAPRRRVRLQNWNELVHEDTVSGEKPAPHIIRWKGRFFESATFDGKRHVYREVTVFDLETGEAVGPCVVCAGKGAIAVYDDDEYRGEAPCIACAKGGA